MDRIQLKLPCKYYSKKTTLEPGALFCEKKETNMGEQFLFFYFFSSFFYYIGN